MTEDKSPPRARQAPASCAALTAMRSRASQGDLILLEPNDNGPRHGELGLAAQTLRELVASCDGSRAACVQIKAALRRLREVARWQFAREEAGGYLADVVRSAPAKRARVAELHHDHCDLMALLDNLLTRADCSQVDVALLRHDIIGLLALLEAHDIAECDALFAYAPPVSTRMRRY